MHCQKCKHDDSKVLETRVDKSNSSIRRRRQCLKCSHRFTTIEIIEKEDLLVIKRDGQTEYFDRQKIINSLRKATEKKSTEELDALSEQVIQKFTNKTQVLSSDIGLEVMHVLKHYDRLAYLRFVSVHKAFNDISDLQQEISQLSQKD